MIKILIIEDNSNKIKVLRDILDRNSEIAHYDVSQDVTEARRFLETNFYDLLILDLNIPKRFGDDPLAENAINLVAELSRGGRLVKPANIIGLTEFSELRDLHQQEFEKYLLLIILYQENSITWEQQLTAKIDYLIKSKDTMIVSSSMEHQFDLVFITALRTPELDFVLKLPVQWQSFKLLNDASEYHKAQFDNGNKTFNLLAVSASQMGMVASSVLTMKVIHSFRPKYIVMTGIAAGIKNKCEIGDLLVAEHSFDYTSGKETTDSLSAAIFQPDFKPIPLSNDLLEDLVSCKGENKYLDEIRNGWVGDLKPRNSIQVHIGPLASGGSVMENTELVTNITQFSRKLIGIDMETYGVYFAANNSSKPKPLGVISIKSVSDFANSEKNDGFQNYASYLSSAYAFKFFTERILK